MENVINFEDHDEALYIAIDNVKCKIVDESKKYILAKNYDGNFVLYNKSLNKSVWFFGESKINYINEIFKSNSNENVLDKFGDDFSIVFSCTSKKQGVQWDFKRK